MKEKIEEKGGGINQNVEKYLDYYYETSNLNYAVAINGKWGTGKTFFIKKKIENWSSDQDSIIKPIYLSLYGLTSTIEITHKLREILFPILHSKGIKFLKRIGLKSIKALTFIDLDTDNDGVKDAKISLDVDVLSVFKKKDDEISGKRILIFDDLERCSIGLKDLLGYINNFIEHNDCKVIVLLNEEELVDKETYNGLKEKLIGQTFLIQPDLKAAIKTFVGKVADADRGNERIINVFKRKENLICDVFNASERKNLRVLRQCLFDYVRFVKELSDEISKQERYESFLESLLAHFLIVYLEYSEKRKDLSLLDDQYIMLNHKIAKEQDDIRSYIQSKYRFKLIKNEIADIPSTIPYRFIVEFITNGYCNQQFLGETLMRNIFFENSDLIGLNKLNNWSSLEDEEFEECAKLVKGYLNELQFKEIGDAFNATVTLIYLIEDGLIKGSVSKLKEKLKKQVGIILDQKKGSSITLFRELPLGRLFPESKIPDCMELFNWLTAEIERHNEEIKKEELKRQFESLDDKNILGIEGLIDREDAIFYSISGVLLAKSLVGLMNKNIDLFSVFLEKRYLLKESLKFYNDNHIKDEKCLSTCKIKLCDYIKDNRSKKLKIRKLKLVITQINLFVEKSEKQGAI